MYSPRDPEWTHVLRTHCSDLLTHPMLPLSSSWSYFSVLQQGFLGLSADVALLLASGDLLGKTQPRIDLRLAPVFVF